MFGGGRHAAGGIISLDDASIRNTWLLRVMMRMRVRIHIMQRVGASQHDDTRPYFPIFRHDLPRRRPRDGSPRSQPSQYYSNT
eukprot:1082215-Prymnesium_polylepis.1